MRDAGRFFAFVGNEQGQFTVPAVQPGAYTVTVTMADGSLVTGRILLNRHLDKVYAVRTT